MLVPKSLESTTSMPAPVFKPCSDPSAVHGDSPLQITVVRLSAPTFWLCWWLGLLLHLFTTVFVFCAAFVHVSLSLPAIHASTPALLMPIHLKRVGGLSYLVVALLHFEAVVQMIYQSTRARRLIFAAPAVSSRRRHSSSPSPSYTSTTKGILWRLYWWLYQGVLAVFGRDGYFGINGRYFNLSITLRELTEVVLQSYQLWALSRSVSRPWINNLAVTTVVLNCWSIPLVRIAFRSRDRARRLMLLTVDMVLDWICSVLIPVCVTLPYILGFDFGKREYPATSNADDVWLANAVADGRQMLVTSYVDLVASLLPQYGIYACLRLLKRLVVRADSCQPTRRGAVVPTAVDKSAMRTQSSRRRIFREARVTRIVDLVLGLWGIMMLSFHLHAKSIATRTSIPGCLLDLSPWFASHPSCSVLYINCHRLNISGFSHETTPLMDHLERSMVTRLIFGHCPALTVPSIVTAFPRLTGLTIHNSSLVEWSSDAAIRQATHPMFINALIGSSNISEIPPGLLHDELPRGTALVLVYNCPLVQLPDNLGDLWASTALARLIVERTSLRSLPASLVRLPIRQLHVANNRITALPGNLLQNPFLDSLRVSGNPLKQLPVYSGDTSALRELLVEHTNVSSLPVWIISWLETHKDDPFVAASLYGSPVCNDTTATPTKGFFQDTGVCEHDFQSRQGSTRAVLIQEQYPP